MSSLLHCFLGSFIGTVSIVTILPATPAPTTQPSWHRQRDGTGTEIIWRTKISLHCGLLATDDNRTDWSYIDTFFDIVYIMWLLCLLGPVCMFQPHIKAYRLVRQQQQRSVSLVLSMQCSLQCSISLSRESQLTSWVTVMTSEACWSSHTHHWRISSLLATDGRSVAETLRSALMCLLRATSFFLRQADFYLTTLSRGIITLWTNGRPS